MLGSMPNLETWSNIVPLVTACVSIIAMIFLLCRLSRLDASRKRRLLVRQLLCLASANLVYLVPEVLQLLSILHWLRISTPLTEHQKSSMCVGFNFVSFVGATAALLFECHMAMVFATSIFRASRVMQILHAGLLYVWLLAAPLAVLRVWWLHLSWRPDEGCATERTDDFFTLFSLSGFLFCFACYVVSTCGVYRAGQAVQRSVWKRAQLYPLVTLVTLAPLVLYYTVGFEVLRRIHDPARYSTVEGVFFMISEGFYDANGLLTFCVYALQNKYVWGGRHSQVQPPTASTDDVHLSFRVNFRQDDSVVNLSQATTTNSWSLTETITNSGSLLQEYYSGVALYGSN